MINDDASPLLGDCEHAPFPTSHRALGQTKLDHNVPPWRISEADAEGVTCGRTLDIGNHACAEADTETLIDIAHANESGNAIGRAREPKRARGLVSPHGKYQCRFRFPSRRQRTQSRLIRR